MKNLVHVVELNDRFRAEKEMRSVGVHGDGIKIMSPKSQFKAVKIKGLSVTSANIIKQEMLVRGGEVATAYGAINHSVPSTDVLIYGTELQFESLLKKLGSQYFGLRQVALDVKEAIKNYNCVSLPVKMGTKTLDLAKRTYIMGILNVTADSFSDGGKFLDINDAVSHADKMAHEGADIIDVGGESTRPGAKPVNEKVELSRVIPVIKWIKKHTKVLISVDTTRANVAAAAIGAGADIVNDISGLRFDSKMIKVVSKNKVPVIIMHIKGKPRNMQKNPVYDDLISEIIFYLKSSIELAIKGGILREKLIVDPGIGFGKTTEHNLEILRRLKEFKSLGCPILVGPSRKSVIGNVLGLPVDERLEGTAAAVAAAVLNGANIVRVHDVMEMKRVAKMADAIKNS